MIFFPNRDKPFLRKACNGAGIALPGQRHGMAGKAMSMFGTNTSTERM